MIKAEHIYDCTVVRVIDGDTVVFSIDAGFRIAVETSTRFVGINCPETNTAAGKKARDYIRKLLPPGTACVCETYKPDPEDSLGRWLATVHLGDMNVNDHLVEAGYAVPYAKKKAAPKKKV